MATTRSGFLTFSASACVAAVTIAALSAWMRDASMARTAPDWDGTLRFLVWAFIGLAVLSQIVSFVWLLTPVVNRMVYGTGRRGWKRTDAGDDIVVTCEPAELTRILRAMKTLRPQVSNRTAWLRQNP